MHYELQTLVLCPDTNDEVCSKVLMKAAKELEDKLRAAGVGFVVEVRDIRRGTKLFRSIDPGLLKDRRPPSS